MGQGEKDRDENKNEGGEWLQPMAFHATWNDQSHRDTSAAMTQNIWEKSPEDDAVGQKGQRPNRQSGRLNPLGLTADFIGPNCDIIIIKTKQSWEIFMK